MRSHPVQSGETFDGPPTLERSGSEHRRAVTTSLYGQERGLVRKAIAILPVVSFLYQTCYNHVYLLFSSAKSIKVLFFTQ